MLKKSDDVKLTIKNMDECTVKIESSNDKSKSVSIKSTSEVYGPLTLQAGENVEEIKIDSINLHGSGSVSSTVPVTVTNLQAQPQTEGKLSKVTVSNELVISQSAVLEPDDDASLSSANLNLNLHTYTASNFDKPMLRGTLGKPPQTIAWIKPKDGSTSVEVTKKAFTSCYLLFQGTFTESCNSWLSNIEYGDTQFNNGVCDDYNAAWMLAKENKSLLVFDDPDKEDGDSGKKLSAGQIAGIVVGCIAGVAIIVAVVIILIKRRRMLQIAVPNLLAEIRLIFKVIH